MFQFSVNYKNVKLGQIFNFLIISTPIVRLQRVTTINLKRIAIVYSKEKEDGGGAVSGPQVEFVFPNKNSQAASTH